MNQQVSLEILEPSGVLKNPERKGLFAPRLTDLNGKTIALLSINIPIHFNSFSDPFFDAVEKKLKERYPEVKILRMNSFVPRSIRLKKRWRSQSSVTLGWRVSKMPTPREDMMPVRAWNWQEGRA